MTYDEALTYWYARIDFERKSPNPGDMKLDRMRALLRAVGDPHRQLRIVHVAGTKGKGSTSAMLASVLRAAGYRVGLFTSPHLTHVSERIQVDGIPISREEIAVRMTEIAAAARAMEEAGDPLRVPTFFEIGAALGLLHFVCRRTDVAIVEVGLGGRFDATNVCMPMLSVITNISLDHMQQLGESLALIASEKAGIIKPRRPVITTAEAVEAYTVIETIARERQAVCKRLGKDFQYEYRAGIFGKQPPLVRITTAQRTWPWLPLGLFGKHQAANAAGVVAIVEQLCQLGMSIDDTSVQRGLEQVHWPARLEALGERPLILLDCAHNVASAQALVDTIRESFPVTGKKRLIFAISNDKQVLEILQVLGRAFDRLHLTRYGNNPRCVPPEQLAELLKAEHPNAHFSLHATAPEALQSAQAAASDDDLIAITGSVFLAGELRPLLV